MDNKYPFCFFTSRSQGSQISSLLSLIHIYSQAIDSYNADWVIVSTPTGSTGYSLSAGGPILMDDMDITLITPICPHTFFSRPIVASAGSEIDIVFKSDSHTAFLTADGQFRVTLAKNDLVSILSLIHIWFVHYPYRENC